MDPYLALLLGLLAGAGTIWLALRKRLQEAELRTQRRASEKDEAVSQLTSAEIEIGSVKAQLASSIQTADERRVELKSQAQALERIRDLHQEQLLKLGDQLGEKFRLHADAVLKQQEKDFLDRADHRLKPLNESLELLRKRSEDLEKARSAAYGSLGKQLDELSLATSSLRSQSESLATALRGSSKARGRWGETTLRNLVELAGLAEHCDFFEQQTSASGTARPDLLVRLPGKEFIPIDAKVPLAAYLDAVEANTPEQRDAFLRTHANDLRNHVRTLGGKDYAREVEGGIDFTVMYLPGDHFLEAAFRFHPSLQEESLAKKVLIVTPVTLLALLKTVQLVWRNEAVAQDSKRILDAALELHNRVGVFAEHMEKLGRGLNTAVKSYSKARSSFESRLLPKGREIEKLAVLNQEALHLKTPIEVEQATLGMNLSTSELNSEEA